MNLAGSKWVTGRNKRQGGGEGAFSRMRRLRGRMTTALLISLFFHLSMITVFRIVVVLPRERVKFYDVRIVSTSDESETPTAATVETPMTRDALALGGASLYDDLPEVELPVIEFAELERLRIRYGATEPVSGGGRAFEDYVPTDSWARFGGELQRLGKTLRALALPDEEEKPVMMEPADRRVLRHRPAEGFEAYIEWSGPPEDRELLFSPPMRVLWQVDPEELSQSLEIVFKVDAGGRVVNVWSPRLDDSGAMEEIQMTVLQYRFAPLAEYGAEESSQGAPAKAVEQSGVLYIRPAGSGL